MRNFSTCTLLLLTIVTSLQAQQIETFTFFDKFDVSITPSKIETILPKSERLNSKHRANIIANISADMPDSMQVCINVAVANWRSYLDNNATVVLNFKYDDIVDDYDVGTEVLYYIDANKKTVYPQCLAKYMGICTSLNDLDAVVHINKNTIWDCGYNSKIISGTNNLTYAIFRSITHALGFGSSVRNRGGSKGITFFSPLGYSVFDRLVFTPSVKLEEIPNTSRENKELKDFSLSNSGIVYVLKDKVEYQLYAPSEGFEAYRSLQYFNDKNSLMSYDLQSGEKFLRVDNRTLDVLHAMGWNIQEPSRIKIIGEGVGDDGIVSAYERCNFKIENDSDYPISQPQWTYTLPLKEGGEAVIETSQSLTYSIPVIESHDRYMINVDGDIGGLLTFKCTVDGKEVIALYNITLELKPKIVSYSEIVKTINNTGTAYSVDFTVRYTGCDYLRVGMQEEYSPSLIMETIEEPYVAHVHIGSINIFNYAWVILNAKNSYGEEEVIITLENLRSGSMNDNITEVPQLSDDLIKAAFIKVYNKEGQFLVQINRLEELMGLNKSVYILQFYNEDGICFKNTKYINGL